MEESQEMRTLLKITTKPCSECPWLGRFDLAPGRLKNIAEECNENDAYFLCHKASQIHKEGEPETVCRGWSDAFPGRGVGIRLAKVLDGLLEVEPI